MESSICDKKRVNALKCILACVLMGFGLWSCSSGQDTPPAGRWEMFVGEDPTLAGQQLGVNDLRYVIELDLSKRTFKPEGELPGGRMSYGFMDFSNVSRIYRYDIDSVADLGNGRYVVKTVDINWMGESLDTLVYDSKTGQLTYLQEFGDDWVFLPVSAPDVPSGEQVPHSSVSHSPMFLLVCSVVGLVIMYLLFKIALGYIVTTLIPAAVGAAVGGLVLWLLIGGFGMELSRGAIIAIVAVPAVPAGLWGLWTAIRSTGDFLSMPLFSTFAKEFAKECRGKKAVITDEQGNRKEARITHGMLGEEYIETSDGEQYERSAADRNRVSRKD